MVRRWANVKSLFGRDIGEAQVPVMAATGDYMKELVKYPPQFKIGFVSNNPPAYDILPKLRETIGTTGVGKHPGPQ
jgi:hypothetical protein